MTVKGMTDAARSSHEIEGEESDEVEEEMKAERPGCWTKKTLICQTQPGVRGATEMNVPCQ